MATDFDFYSEEFQNNPAPKYAEMIEKCPFHKNEEQGWYAVFRHADIMDIVRDNQQFSVRTGPGTNYADENTAQFLLVAGAATTTVTIGSFFNLMIEHPDQWEKLKADSGLTMQAIEETLRLCSPVHGLFRTNNEAMELGGYNLEPDTKIGLMWASGNLDPEVFDDPLAFDIERESKSLRKHLSFGHGLHVCIGAPLARLEIRVVVEEFLKRFDGLERSGPMVPYPYPTLHGPYKLPVRLVPKSG